MLEGVRIVDLTTSLAGPYAAMLLADFGADVIKVERRAGDDSRQWGPPFLDADSLWFLAVNRNKRSLALDFTSTAGRAILDALLNQADVCIVNQTADVQAKLGLDGPTVRANRPKLIHLSISGFGLDGPKADLPCYDLIAEGYSGVMDLTGPADREAQKIGAPAADMLAGADGTMAVLAALFRRSRTGRGCTLDVSLTESMIRFVSPRIVPYLASGDTPRRTGAKDSVVAVMQTFETADLPLTLGIGNDAIWTRFWAAVGLPGEAARQGMESNATRRARRPEIVIRIQEVLRTRTRAEWLAVFAEAKVPAGPIYRVDEVTEEPHFLARELFYRVTRHGHDVPQVGLGIHVDGASPGCSRPPPRLGEHGSEILRNDLQFEDEAIAALQASGVI